MTSLSLALAGSKNYIHCSVQLKLLHYQMNSNVYMGWAEKAWNRMVICLPFCLCLVTDLAHLDIPSIHVEVDATLHLDPSGQVQRHPVPGKISSEEDSESTAL